MGRTRKNNQGPVVIDKEQLKALIRDITGEVYGNILNDVEYRLTTLLAEKNNIGGQVSSHHLNMKFPILEGYTVMSHSADGTTPQVLNTTASAGAAINATTVTLAAVTGIVANSWYATFGSGATAETHLITNVAGNVITIQGGLITAVASSAAVSCGSNAIAWKSLTIVYNGQSYPITDGTTNKKYVYWLLSKATVDTTQNLTTSNGIAGTGACVDSLNGITIGPDDLVLFSNSQGVVSIVSKPGQLTDGGTLTGSISAPQIQGTLANATVLGTSVTGTVASATNATNATTATNATNVTGTIGGSVSVPAGQVSGALTGATIAGSAVSSAVANATNAVNATNATTATNANNVTGTIAGTVTVPAGQLSGVMPSTVTGVSPTNLNLAMHLLK